jgi:hypothetical protein
MLTIRVLYRNTAVHDMILELKSVAQTVDMLNNAPMVEAYQIFRPSGVVRDHWNFGWEHKPEKWVIDGFIVNLPK